MGLRQSVLVRNPVLSRSGRLTVRCNKCAQVAIPHASFNKVDQSREDDERHDEEEGQGKEGVFGPMDGNVHDLDRAMARIDQLLVIRLAMLGLRLTRASGSDT